MATTRGLTALWRRAPEPRVSVPPSLLPQNLYPSLASSYQSADLSGHRPAEGHAHDAVARVRDGYGAVPVQCVAVGGAVHLCDGGAADR